MTHQVWQSPHGLQPYGWRGDFGDLHTLAMSIQLDGWGAPIVVDPDGRVLSGERRLQVALRYQHEQVPTVVVKTLEDVLAEVKRGRTVHPDLARPVHFRELLFRVGYLYEWDTDNRRDRRSKASARAAQVRAGTLERSDAYYNYHKDLAEITETSASEVGRALVAWRAYQDPQRHDQAVKAIESAGSINQIYNLLRGVDGASVISPNSRTGQPVTGTQVQAAFSQAIGGIGVIAGSTGIKDLTPAQQRQLRSQLTLLRRQLATVAFYLSEAKP